jgi:hypothetical protein
MIQDILAAYAATEYSRTFHNRHLTVGASEIGQCARATWYAKHVPDRAVEGFNGYATRGNVLERHWLEPALRAYFGDRLVLSGDDQQTFKSGDLSATPDALVRDLTTEEAVALGLPVDVTTVVVELKSVDPRTPLDEPKPQWVSQMLAQLGLLNKRTNHAPQHGMILAADCSDLSVKTFVVPFDPAAYANLKIRARQIMTAQSADELKPEGWIAQSGECDLCPFRGPCGIARTTPPAGNGANLDPGVIAQIAALGRKIIAADAAAEAAAQEARAYKEDLRNLLRDNDTRKATCDGVQVSWSPVAGRKTLDAEALRAAGIDPELYQKVGAPSDRLVVKVISSQPRSAAK